MARGRWLAPIHLAVGAATLVVFLVSGAYMRMHEPPVGYLEPGLHMMFTSRHIYILAAALIHLVLGASVSSGTRRGVLVVQTVGSVLLVLSAALLITAFVVEPMAGRSRTHASSFGLYSLFAGSLLHVLAGLWNREVISLRGVRPSSGSEGK